MTNRETPQAAETRPGRRTALTRPPAQRTASEATEGPAPVDDGWIRVTPLNRAMPAPARRGAPGPDARDTPAVRTPTAGMGATLAEARKRADAALARTGTAPDRAAKSWAPASGSAAPTRETAAETTPPGKTHETGAAPAVARPRETGAAPGAREPETGAREGSVAGDAHGAGTAAAITAQPQEAGAEARRVAGGAGAAAVVVQPQGGGAEAGSGAPQVTAEARGTESVPADAGEAETGVPPHTAEATGEARESEARTENPEAVVTAGTRRAEAGAPASGTGTRAPGATGPRGTETGPRTP
ncbi:hypothetical protein ACFYXJ_25075, partial [Streptomyces sp. NPDC002667]